MTPSEFFADLSTNCLTEVDQAATSYYSQERGLTVRQSFFVYPDDTIVCLNSCDGSYAIIILEGDDAAIFNHRYLSI
jgi:hypothetical protein